MRDNRRHSGATLLLASGVLLCAITQSGCLSSPSDNPPPPAGGQEYVVDYDVFATAIDSILTAKGCDNLACHGGGIRGTFQLSPFDDKDIDMDFAQVRLQVTGSNPAASPLLVKPLDEAAGGVAHTADAQQFGFMSTSDPDYQAILTWIQAGEYR